MPADKTLLNQWMPVKIENVSKLGKLKVMSVMDVIAILALLTGLWGAVVQYMNHERIPFSLNSKAWRGLLINIIFFALFAVFSFGYDRQIISLQITILILSTYVREVSKKLMDINLIFILLLISFFSLFYYFYLNFIIKKICNINISIERVFDVFHPIDMYVYSICETNMNSPLLTIAFLLPGIVVMYSIAIDSLLIALKNNINGFLSHLLIMITCGIGLCLGWLVRLIFF